MNEHSSNNKRIAKNTVYLYCRTIIVMLISLYTSRVVLQNLGVVDFGLYNVVGGVVLMFAFLSNAMTAAVQRFISFELGRKNEKKLRNVFCLSVSIHILLALIVLLLVETIGFYFFYHYLVIPPDRLAASHVVYQCAVFSFFITIVQVPYRACIVAHEKMNVFATISILESVMKLIVASMLFYISGDHLIYYALFMLFIPVSTTIMYKVYSTRNFEECKYRLYWNRNLFIAMTSYFGWSLFGGMASVISMQGINILLNTFFGPVVNAAYGIAYQVNSAVYALYGNFTVAINPQIIKQYSVGNIKYMHQLILRGSRFSYLLLLIFICPLLLETHGILKLWLGQVPEYAVLFCRLILISLLVDCLSIPFASAIQATGKIKKYQLLIGGILSLNLPVSYVVLKFSHRPELCLYVNIVITCLMAIVKLVICKILLSLSIKEYVCLVLKRILPVTFISMTSCLIPLLLQERLPRLFLSFIVGVIVTLFAIIIVGIEREERLFLLNKIKALLCRKSI